MDVFKTSRLTIRKISVNDLDKLAPILSDETTMQYTPSGALSPEQMIDFIENCVEQYRDTGFGYWAIFVTETDELIGLCGLNRHIVDKEEHLHVNYRLGTGYLGKGFATETVNGLKSYCVRQLNSKRLSAIIEPTNTGSISVVQRAGFEFVRQTNFKNLNVNIYRTLI